MARTVNPPDLIAATLDYAFDYERIAREIRSCEEYFVYTPPYLDQIDDGLSGELPFMSESAENYGRIDVFKRAGIERHELRGVRIFYLRNSKEGDVTRDARFATNKGRGHESWFWRPELAARIGYTIECIESLPYRTLGLVRTFVCENTFMPTHRDTVPDRSRPEPYDRSKALGISLIPSTGDVGMQIWDDAGRRIHEVRGHCILFDDSKWHGVPMTRGTRITMRIFGEVDYARLSEHLVQTIPS
jgi:hypothetical protein